MINAVNIIVELSAVSLYDANAFLANKQFDNVLYFLGKTQLFALLRVKIT